MVVEQSRLEPQSSRRHSGGDGRDGAMKDSEHPGVDCDSSHRENRTTAASKESSLDQPSNEMTRNPEPSNDHDGDKISNIIIESPTSGDMSRPPIVSSGGQIVQSHTAQNAIQASVPMHSRTSTASDGTHQVAAVADTQSYQRILGIESRPNQPGAASQPVSASHNQNQRASLPTRPVLTAAALPPPPPSGPMIYSQQSMPIFHNQVGPNFGGGGGLVPGLYPHSQYRAQFLHDQTLHGAMGFGIYHHPPSPSRPEHAISQVPYQTHPTYYYGSYGHQGAHSGGFMGSSHQFGTVYRHNMGTIHSGGFPSAGSIVPSNSVLSERG